MILKIRISPLLGLATLTVLSLPAPSSLHSATVNWFGMHGVPLPDGGTCNSMALIIKLVAAGHGIALVPGPVAREARDNGSVELLKVRSAAPSIAYYVSYLQELAPVAREKLVPLARKVFSECGLICTQRKSGGA